MGLRGPSRSKERLRLEADLLRIEERLRQEAITYEQLAHEYGLSLGGIKKSVAASGFAKRLSAARRDYLRSAKAQDDADRKHRSRRRLELKEKRLKRLAEALAQGKTMVEVARELGMDKSNLSRLAKEARLFPRNSQEARVPTKETGKGPGKAVGKKAVSEAISSVREGCQAAPSPSA